MKLIPKLKINKKKHNFFFFFFENMQKYATKNKIYRNKPYQFDDKMPKGYETDK